MKISRTLIFFAIFASFLGPQSCSAQPVSSSTPQPEVARTEKKYEDMIVCFSQLGSESEWRVANTLSIKETA